MTDTKDQEKKVLSLSGRGKLELPKKPAPAGSETGSVRQSFSHGRSKQVTVEVKRKRTLEKGAVPGVADGGAAARRAAEGGTSGQRQGAIRGGPLPRELSREEKEARLRALLSAREESERRTTAEPDDAVVGTAEAFVEERPAPEAVPEGPPEPLDADTLRRRELEELHSIQEQERQAAAEAERRRLEEEARRKEAEAARRGVEEPRRSDATRGADAGAARPQVRGPAGAAGPAIPAPADEEEDSGRARRPGGGGTRAPAKVPAPSPKKGAMDKRRSGKLTVTQALDDGGGERTRSLAAFRRARERERLRMMGRAEQQKVARDVIIPEVITVQELANRMAERGADVIKALMRMGVMATITQAIDGDTAQLIAEEFGHRVRRVSEADVELGLDDQPDAPEDLQPRPPVVTIMGHVDHGKTSLLDAMRKTDVVAHEAGGITQHIGAYQVQARSGGRITFIDTPGHAAFTAMRARGANVTDIVVLVVAANDSVMPQTVEAINHAQAAKVPLIVAINKVDLPDAKPDRVRQDLLQHGLVVEELGGDILTVEVSAKTRLGLDKLEEAILLQAEVLELRANPDRPARGTVVEAKLERGRGSVATVLVQNGTLKVGDIFVAGTEWGRVRALINERGATLTSAAPATPVEVLGWDGTPMAGDEFIVVESEARARDITEFRQRKKREQQLARAGRGTLEQMFDSIKAGEVRELAVVIKGDVQGSVEAIASALEKLGGDQSEVKVRVLHQAVGAITESDITLANASKAMIIGFNVRANPLARDMARRDGVEIRYYSIIYNVIDEVKQALSGLLAPTFKEVFLGYANILQVFEVSKVGKVAGCRVTEGLVKRGAGVRLLRDNVVIHTGTLKTLRRFKDEVREVREGYECGMAFENYDDIREGDQIECYEMEQVARAL
ncbi:MAG TPA: translation initiation factor IF-2 [Azospirillaceae bacterium]|nr:translation initiation factor IF-2 [Azospirillaceae bacterium]